MHTRSTGHGYAMRNKPRFSFLCTSSNRVLGLVIETVLIEDGSFLADVPSEMWCPSPHDGFWFMSAKALSSLITALLYRSRNSPEPCPSVDGHAIV
jgi:hypothetical protein